MVSILKGTLKGKRIALTRSKDQCVELRGKIEAHGGEVIELPLIKVLPHCNPDTLDDVFNELGSYAWIIFTSRNGVSHFFDFFFKRFKDIRCIGGMKIACVGEGTAAEVEKYHLEVDFIPEEALAETLADGLIEFETLDSEKILVVTGNLNRDTLVKKLEGEGHAIVDTLQVYETEMTDLSQDVDAEGFREDGADAVVFASSSAVHSFVKQAGALQLGSKAKKPKTCSIGPATSQTMKEVGMPMDIEAKEHSLEGIVQALLFAWAPKG